MTNRRNGGGVAEDIWMNTPAGLDEREPHQRIDPNGPDSPANWDEVEEANAILNPDIDSLDWRG